MRTTTNVIRVVFLALAMVTYARPSFAGSPYWWGNCNSGCTGSARYHQCTFEDIYDYWDTKTGDEACEDSWLTEANHTSCCGGSQYSGDIEHEALYHWYEECRTWGGGGPPTFTGWSCAENGTRGGFYCSYQDESCGG